MLYMSVRVSLSMGLSDGQVSMTILVLVQKLHVLILLLFVDNSP